MATKNARKIVRIYFGPDVLTETDEIRLYGLTASGEVFLHYIHPDEGECWEPIEPITTASIRGREEADGNG